ncbi:MAG: LysR family transcriptional regulator [Roseovarius sp.]|uniref:LysR family transcriptional regulator n=1 Tax=Roseovarius sp. TaxID=1486281 RepID=UPI004058CAF4
MATSRSKLSYARLFDDLRVLLAVHRCGSMTRAAEELETTTSTVSRQIARLREELGISPFVKSDGGWLLNPRLSSLIEAFEHADGMIFSELSRVSESGPDEARDIRIGALPSIISHVLVPAMKELWQERAHLRPVFESRVYEAGLGMSDVALVFNLPETGRLKTRRCGAFPFALYAPRGWKKGDGWASLTDRYAAQYAEARRAWFGSDAILKADSFTQVIPAMHSLGLAAVLPTVMAAGDPDLVHLPGSGLDVSRDLYLIYHESRSEDADLRAVVDWICRHLTDLPSAADELLETQGRLYTIQS